MDNVASHAIKEFLTSKHIGVKQVEPHNHHVNAVEYAIQSFKNHVIVGLCATNCDFPLRLWHEFLLQAEQSLNMLQTLDCGPTKSAYELLYGPFDYNCTLWLSS